MTLSLRQPWAWAVLHAGKTIENRKWNTSFRGDFFIHAAKGLTWAEFEDAARTIEIVMGWDRATRVERMPSFPELARGGVVGRARLVDVIPPCDGPCEHMWHMPGQFGFVLEHVEELPFEACAGRLGFFDLDRPGAWRGRFA